MEAYDSLVGRIYDTITDHDSWPTVLLSINDFVGAERSILILEDALDTANSMFYLSFDDPEWIGRYLDTYLLLNPMRLALFGHAEPGAVILTSDIMTPQEYGSSRFATEFLSQRNLVDVAVAVLEATATTITVLSFARSREQGFADEQVRQKLCRLGPHVRRAASIGRVLQRQTLETAALSDTLDTLAGAIFLLDEQSTVLHSNRAAQMLLSCRGDAISSVGGRLWAVDPQARALLADLLARASAGDGALGTHGVALTFASTAGSTLIGTIISLVGGSRRKLNIRYKAIAALFIREVRFSAPTAATVLGSLYGLTRREIAVAAGVSEFGGVPRTAAILGLANETVRTHLKSIFRKTGTRNQAELAKLLTSTASPFRQ